MIDRKVLIKSIAYRIYSFLITILVSFMLTGNWIFSTAIAFVDSMVKIITYYAFDIVWSRYDCSNKIINKLWHKN